MGAAEPGRDRGACAWAGACCWEKGGGGGRVSSSIVCIVCISLCDATPASCSPAPGASLLPPPGPPTAPRLMDAPRLALRVMPSAPTPPGLGSGMKGAGGITSGAGGGSEAAAGARRLMLVSRDTRAPRVGVRDKAVA